MAFSSLRRTSPIGPSSSLDSGEHPHYAALLKNEQVVRVYLDEWAHSRRTLTQHLMAVVLAEPQQAIPEAQAVVARARQESVDTGQTTTIVDLVEAILVYKLPRLSRQEIQTMLGLTDIDLKQTRFYQDAFAEGAQEGEVTLVLRLLQRRCGELASTLTEQVTHLSVSQLETLGEALLDFQSVADLEQWLAAHGQQTPA